MQNTFDQIFDRLQQGRLWDFPGGVHPPGRKELSNHLPIQHIPLPEKVIVPVKQHIGIEGKVQVSVGERVLKGQALTRSSNPFAVPVHAPTSGIVTNIAPHISAHPSALPEMAIEIEVDKEDEWISLSPLPDYQNVPKAQIVEAICNAGISGMGGAGFPTHIKSTPKKDVDFLIINGVECEPYITADDRLMREHAWQIRQGIDVLFHLLKPRMVLIAIEDNKPLAIEAMQVACQERSELKVVSVPTKYPAGGEKQLIQVLTGREVPKGNLPIDVGVIMQNVGTCYAIADAIFNGKPLIQRVVTLTGQACEKPQNMWALIGTPVRHLLGIAQYHSNRQKTRQLIMGGPMMGFTLASDDVPVVKTTNCILAPTADEMVTENNEQACIRCSACADACPANLLPQQLYWHSKANELDKAQDYNLFDCIECGACAFVCPSEIPLVQYYRGAKADIRAQQEEQQKADKARERFEARKARLEREAQEREEKHRKAAEARKQAMAQPGSDAKDKIAAALARAKAKKAEAADVTTSADAPISNQQDKVAAAIARAKAKRAQQQAESTATENISAPGTDTPAVDDKKAAVAAAIARAKAKRDAAKAAEAGSAPDAEAAQNVSDAPSVLDPEAEKKARVAAAVAKAKAKRDAAKAAEAGSAPDAEAAQDASDAPSVIDPEAEKKARVAAAVAKAKAKRDAAKAAEAGSAPDAESAQNVSDAPSVMDAEAEKKARIAAAVAKAKAKRDAAKATEAGSAPDAEAAQNVSDAPSVMDAEAEKKARIAAAVAKAKAKREAAKASPSSSDDKNKQS